MQTKGEGSRWQENLRKQVGQAGLWWKNGQEDWKGKLQPEFGDIRNQAGRLINYCIDKGRNAKIFQVYGKRNVMIKATT